MTRIYNIWNAALAAVIASAIAIPHATATPPGADIYIDQIDIQVTTTSIRQEGIDNHVTVSQNGPGNFADIELKGDFNGANGGGMVEQDGSGNTTLIRTKGDSNTFEVSQSSAGASNKAVVLQNGDSNSASVEQTADGLTDLKANLAIVAQHGDRNGATISQNANDSRPIIAENIAKQLQVGDGNAAKIRQNGQNNTAIQVQVGDDNVSDILQDGDDNFAVHRQYGDNLMLQNGAFGAIGIEQFGGASIIVEQYDAGGAPGY